MQTKVIRQKIKSVGSIKKITKTMEMISAAKMKKAIDQALTLRPFHEEAEHILEDMSLDPLMRHELLKHNEVDTDLVILVTSNKGLCGGFNVNIYRKLIELYNEEGRKKLKVIAFGKYAEKVAKKLHLETVASFNHPVLTGDHARVVANMIVDLYKQKKIGTVKILYTDYVSASSFEPTIIQLLPFATSKKSGAKDEPRYTYEPDQDSVLSTIVPMIVHNLIYGAILESYASEHSARMFAMKSATDNANDLQKDLKLYYNRARQSAVTQEISEIVGGAAALAQ
ncbi:MAG: ATP synthase F1 subunit gamma [Candidatus Pacebacteria bacterium]|nr:ATP synthase F1 subunit gamma [Candidatus Paceibacterota bacterium]